MCALSPLNNRVEILRKNQQRSKEKDELHFNYAPLAALYAAVVCVYSALYVVGESQRDYGCGCFALFCCPPLLMSADNPQFLNCLAVRVRVLARIPMAGTHGSVPGPDKQAHKQYWRFPVKAA